MGLQQHPSGKATGLSAVFRHVHAYGIAQRVIQGRQRPVEQPHDGTQEGRRTLRGALPGGRRIPRDALRLARRHRQGPPDGRRDPLGARTAGTDRDRLEARHRTPLPPQRHALRSAERRPDDRQLARIQHRRRGPGRRNLAARPARKHLPPDDDLRDQGVVLPRGQDLLGVRSGLRGPRHLGLSRRHLDGDVRNDRTWTEQRRRAPRRSEGRPQGQHLLGQVEELRRIARLARPDLRLRPGHLRGERLGRRGRHGPAVPWLRPGSSATSPRPTPRSREPKSAARAK